MSSEKYTLVEGGLLIDTQLSATNEERYPLFVDATSVARAPDDRTAEARARRMLELLWESGIGHYTMVEEGAARDLTIHIGFQRHGYGVFGMEADFLWPSVSDEEASDLATKAMRRMARDLGLYKDVSKKEFNGMIYANVDRARGITLETNPAGSSSMDTNGNRYRSGSERVRLEAHNLYRHEMQLVTIAGIIALAQAHQPSSS